MKMKKIGIILLGAILFAQAGYAQESPEEARERLLEAGEKALAEKAEAERKAAEEAAAEAATEGQKSGEETAMTDAQAMEDPEAAKMEKERRKHMTESQKMDEEIQRIKTRMLEINSNMENYLKNN